MEKDVKKKKAAGSLHSGKNVKNNLSKKEGRIDLDGKKDMPIAVHLRYAPTVDLSKRKSLSLVLKVESVADSWIWSGS